MLGFLLPELADSLVLLLILLLASITNLLSFASSSSFAFFDVLYAWQIWLRTKAFLQKLRFAAEVVTFIAAAAVVYNSSKSQSNKFEQASKAPRYLKWCVSITVRGYLEVTF